jgi:hypothetical protein
MDRSTATACTVTATACAVTMLILLPLLPLLLLLLSLLPLLLPLLQVRHAQCELVTLRHREKLSAAKLASAQLLSHVTTGGHTLISWAAACGQASITCTYSSMLYVSIAMLYFYGGTEQC